MSALSYLSPPSANLALQYGLATFGVCTGANYVAGLFGRAACEIATFPGSWDCTSNSIRCYFQSCGLLGFRRRRRR